MKEIGEGTFGKVFLAWNKEGRQVAIKRVSQIFKILGSICWNN